MIKKYGKTIAFDLETGKEVKNKKLDDILEKHAKKSLKKLCSNT